MSTGSSYTYIWCPNDSDTSVTKGANNTLYYAGRIQDNDGYGGYNTKFTIRGQLGEYHVHFKAGGTKVTTVKLKASSSDAKGTVICKPKDSKNLKTFSQLKHEAGTSYPNHQSLMTNLKDAISDTKRKPNNELE